MYADVVTIVVGQTSDVHSNEVEELFTETISPTEGGFDPDAVSEAARSEVVRRGFATYTFDEQRRYTEVGASGADVTFVLTLLGSGATGVAMQELLNFIKARVATTDDDENIDLALGETTIEAPTRWAVSAAERDLGLPRGDLEVEEFKRDQHKGELRARSHSRGHLYEVVWIAECSLRAKRLGDAE